MNTSLRWFSWVSTTQLCSLDEWRDLRSTSWLSMQQNITSGRCLWWKGQDYLDLKHGGNVQYQHTIITNTRFDTLKSDSLMTNTKMEAYEKIICLNDRTLYWHNSLPQIFSNNCLAIFTLYGSEYLVGIFDSMRAYNCIFPIAIPSRYKDDLLINYHSSLTVALLFMLLVSECKIPSQLRTFST